VSKFAYVWDEGVTRRFVKTGIEYDRRMVVESIYNASIA
jgi:hypothetical protein